MNDYILLMHALPPGSAQPTGDWTTYLHRLRSTGQFNGGSSIGAGVCVSSRGITPTLSTSLTGSIRVSAPSIEEACALLDGHPLIEAGGTVEVRELPRD
jgi:hypothetical protein